LEPEAAFAEAQRLAAEKGEGMAIAPRTLLKRLHERRLLAEVDCRGGKTRLTVRHVLDGQRRAVIVLRPQSIFTLTGSGPSVPIEENHAENQGAKTPNEYQDEWPLPSPSGPEAHSPPGECPSRNGKGQSFWGEMGHLGYLDTGVETID